MYIDFLFITIFIKMKRNIYLLLISVAIAYLINKLIFNVDSTLPLLSTLLLVTIYLSSFSCTIYGLVFITFLSFLFSLELFYVINFHERFSLLVLDSVIEKNPLEMVRMSSSFLPTIIIPSLLLCMILLYIRLKTKKYKMNNYIFLLIFFLLSLLTIKNIYSTDRLVPDIREDNKILGKYLYNKFPTIIGDLSYLLISVISNDKYKQDNLSNKIVDESILNTKSSNNPYHNIVVIIGESSLSSRYHSYGYEKNTTPNLDKMIDNGIGCIVNNVHSSAPITRDSISMSLSFNSPENDEKMFSRKTIIDMAKDSNYSTYWIGSQSLNGVYSSKYGYIAKKSDHIFLTQEEDDKIPDILEKEINNNSENKFIVIHLLGSHLPYTNYYYNDKKNNPDMDDYDLTILKTDNIIRRIQSIVENSGDYILIYTSDHGEIVNKGHGFRYGKDQFLIPLFLFTNQDQKICKYINKFRNNNGWLNGNMNKYILSEFLSYNIDEKHLDKEKEQDKILNTNSEIMLFEQID